MIKNVNEELKREIGDLIGSGETPPAVKKVIMERTGFKKTKANDIYNEVLFSYDFQNEIFDFDLAEEAQGKSEPYYNKELGKYIVYIPYLGRNIVISEEKHNTILRLYSDWSGEAHSINEVCRAVQIPRQILTAYLKAFGISHDSLPISEADFAIYDDVELTARLHELRKFSLVQKFEKEDWNATRAAALKWRDFEYKKLNPFIEVVKNWSVPKYTAYVPKLYNDSTSNVLLSVLSDLHFGMISDKATTYRQIKNSSEIIGKRLEELASYIVEDTYIQKLSEIKVLFLGDLINSANDQGYTVKGTIVDNDLKGGELFKFALDKICIFLNTLIQTGIKVSCLGCTGNHDGALGAALLYAGKAHFRDEIKDFEVTNRFIDKTIIKNSLICYSHGSAAAVKAKIPNTAAKLEKYASSLFLEAQKEYPNCNSRYLYVGDLHHSKSIEFNDFEYILVPSLAGGGNFSDALNLNSRARQQTFLFDNNGIKTINNYFFS